MRKHNEGRNDYQYLGAKIWALQTEIEYTEAGSFPQLYYLGHKHCETTEVRMYILHEKYSSAWMLNLELSEQQQNNLGLILKYGIWNNLAGEIYRQIREIVSVCKDISEEIEKTIIWLMQS